MRRDTNPSSTLRGTPPLLPELASRYQQYLDATDSLLDEPTVRIMERALPDLARMRREAAAALTDYPALGVAAPHVGSAMAARLGAIDPWVAHRAPASSSGAAA